MKRSEFIRATALGTLAVCAGCLAACSKDEAPAPPTLPPGGLEIDLSKPENQSLVPVGGSLVKSGIIVAQVAQDSYTALAVACTHEGTSVIYRSAQQDFRCPNHGSLFDVNGAVKLGPAQSNLKKYTVTKTGNILRIT
jgi:cytochrome b6-f complex iron-sulfur subunit